MESKITRIVYNNMFDEMGDDMILVHIFFSVDGSEELRMPAMIHLDFLFKFVAQRDKVVGKYLLGIRKGIYGYGPKDSIVMATIKEEGFDLDRWAKEYFFTLDEGFITSSVAQNENIKRPEVQKSAERKCRQIQSLLEENNFKNNQIKHIAFLEAVDTALHEAAFNFYPEVFEMGDKHEYAYKNLLISTVFRYAEELGKICTSQFTEYFEREYKQRLEEEL